MKQCGYPREEVKDDNTKAGLKNKQNKDFNRLLTKDKGSWKISDLLKELFQIMKNNDGKEDSLSKLTE